jgi:integrase
MNMQTVAAFVQSKTCFHAARTKRHVDSAFRRVPIPFRQDVRQEALVTAFVTCLRMADQGRRDQVSTTPSVRFAMFRARDRHRVGSQQRHFRRFLRATTGIAAYLSDIRTRKRSAKTLNKYTTVLGRVKELASRLCRKNLLEIDLAFLDVYRQDRVERDGADPDSTVIDDVVVIKQLINFARSRGMIGIDPLKRLRIPNRKRRPQPCWRPAEVEKIVAAASEPYRTVYTILADTGFRIGEVQFLTWDDVDFENNLLHVRAKEGWKPKDGDQRSVPMSVRARAMLERLPRQSRWVVMAPASPRYPKGDHENLDRRALRALKRVLKRLGLRGKIHTFRHAFLFHALIRGTPEALVRAWAGHVDWDILKLYTHIANSDSQEAMKRLSKTDCQTPVSKESEEEKSDVTEDGSAQFQHNEGNRDEGENTK